MVIEFLLVYLFIPYLPKLAAFFDRIFVNGFGLPYNTGALFFLVGLLVLCFWALFITLKKGRVFWNTVILCVTTLVMGFSLFSIVIIRSSVKTPTNEYQPDNPYTLVRYLSREQYGSTPLLYGQYFDAPYDLTQDKYWAPLNGKYVKADAPADADYLPEGKMLFPRMWSGADPRYIDFYQTYTQGKGTRVKGAKHRKPSFGANMAYFFDYQLNWMYWRYFMWNFRGPPERHPQPAAGQYLQRQLGERHRLPGRIPPGRPVGRSGAAAGEQGQEPLLLPAAAAGPAGPGVPVRQRQTRQLDCVPDVLHDGHRHRAVSEPAAVPGAGA